MKKKDGKPVQNCIPHHVVRDSIRLARQDLTTEGHTWVPTRRRMHVDKHRYDMLPKDGNKSIETKKGINQKNKITREENFIKAINKNLTHLRIEANETSNIQSRI